MNLRIGFPIQHRVSKEFSEWRFRVLNSTQVQGVFIVNGGWGFQSNTQYQWGFSTWKFGTLFFYLIEVQGVLVNEGWGFQSNPKVQGGFSEARVGFPIQPKILGFRELVPSPNKPPWGHTKLARSLILGPGLYLVRASPPMLSMWHSEEILDEVHWSNPVKESTGRLPGTLKKCPVFRSLEEHQNSLKNTLKSKFLTAPCLFLIG